MTFADELLLCAKQNLEVRFHPHFDGMLSFDIISIGHNQIIWSAVILPKFAVEYIASGREFILNMKEKAYAT